MLFPDYRITSGSKVDLAAFDPAAKPCAYANKAEALARLASIGARLDELQTRIRAQQRDKVLLILQGMDTSGKDGTIRTVFHTMNPAGVRVTSFKAPTPYEQAHDFLWRVHRHVPVLGEIAIFNRSHYEDVLVTRVHGLIDSDECERRFRHIREFERMLVETGTTLIKCFLHISADEQRARLQARLDNPDKHWKFDLADLAERKHWRAYQRAYADALAATSTASAPWYVIPADSKTHSNLMVAELLLDTLSGLMPVFPPGRPELKGMTVPQIP